VELSKQLRFPPCFFPDLIFKSEAVQKTSFCSFFFEKKRNRKGAGTSGPAEGSPPSFQSKPLVLIGWGLLPFPLSHQKPLVFDGKEGGNKDGGPLGNRMDKRPPSESVKVYYFFISLILELLGL
jgi:hypothetical protein